MNITQIVILVIGYIVLAGTSGIVLNYILSKISAKAMSQTVSKETLDTGYIIGKCENFLILTFMFLEAYTALALVFSAKAIIRKEDIAKTHCSSWQVQ